MNTVNSWRKKHQEFELRLQALLSQPLPALTIGPALGDHLSPGSIMGLIEGELYCRSVMQIVQVLQKLSPGLDCLAFVKNVAECKNYGSKAHRRNVWEIKKKFWGQLNISQVSLQQCRKARRAYGKAICDLQKLVQTINALGDQDRADQLDELLMNAWESEKKWIQFKTVKPVESSDEEVQTTAQDNSLESFVIKLQKNYDRASKKGHFLRLGRKPKRPLLPKARQQLLLRCLQKGSDEWSEPKFTKVKFETRAELQGRSFVMLSDSYCVRKYATRKKEVWVDPLKPCDKNDRLNYQQDSQEEYYQLTGQNLDKVQIEQQDDSYNSQEDGSFLVADGYLSDDELQDSQLEKVSTNGVNISNNSWQINPTSPERLRYAVIALEPGPICLQEQSVIKQALPDQLIPELLAMFHQSEKYKDNLISEFLATYPIVTRKSVERLIKHSVRKEDRFWRVRREVAEEMGMLQQLNAIREEKSKKRESLSKSKPSKSKQLGSSIK